jgi:hypothetical protein
MTTIHIDIKGIEKIQKALDKFPQEIQRTIEAAGEETAKKVLSEQGLKKYPPATSANQPPTPYYIRGRGTQTAHGNLNNSERLGTQWTVKSNDLKTTIGNRASYARWVHGEEQAHFMAPKGWRKLTDVATEKIPVITQIYQAWINRLIKKLGL